MREKHEARFGLDAAAVQVGEGQGSLAHTEAVDWLR